VLPPLGTPGAPFLAFYARSGIACDKNDYRGIFAGLEDVSGKKAVDSETMTGKRPIQAVLWLERGSFPPKPPANIFRHTPAN
jgi:hypothetical protein